MKKVHLIAMALILIVVFIHFGFSSPAFADQTWFRVTVKNTSGQNINDFHADFSGTGGTLDNGRMRVNPGGPATIVAEEAWVDITWDPPGLAAGAVFVFEFTSEFIAVYAWGDFTVDGSSVGEANDVSVEGPFPTPTVTHWGLLILVGLMLVSGLLLWKRKRARAVA